MLIFGFFYSKNPEKYVLNCFKYWSSANQHIRVISEGSCDTEDWSNDAENTALITGINYILKYIQTENSYFK